MVEIMFTIESMMKKNLWQWKKCHKLLIFP